MKPQFAYTSDYFDSLEGKWSRVSFPIISQLLKRGLSRYDSVRSILDLGCGNGRYFAVLKQHSKKVTGMDISEEAVLRCKAQHSYDVLQLGEAIAMPFAEGTFDVVFSTEVLEHIQDSARVFREVYRVLNDNGTFIFTTTLYWHAIWTYWHMSKRDQHHLCRRLRESLRYIIGYYNEKVQQQFICEWCFKQLGGHYHGFHIMQLKELLTSVNFEICYLRPFFVIKPIPVLGGGSIERVLKKRFPTKMALMPLVPCLVVMNKVLEVGKVGANNIFIIAKKGASKMA